MPLGGPLLLVFIVHHQVTLQRELSPAMSPGMVSPRFHQTAAEEQRGQNATSQSGKALASDKQILTLPNVTLMISVLTLACVALSFSVTFWENQAKS